MKSIILSLLIIFSLLNTIMGQKLPTRDLMKIKKEIGHSRIIGFGEEEHFYLGSNTYRIEVIKRLIRDSSINSIVFEIPGTDAFIVNEYIHNRIDKSNLLASLKQFTTLNAGPFFDSKEIFSFIEWLKTINQENYDIEVSGMDFYNYIAAIQNLQKIENSKELQNNFGKIKETLDTLTYYLHNNPSQLTSAEITKKSTENLSLVKETLSKIDTSLSKLSTWAARDLYDYSYWFTDINNRDSMLFQNFVNIDNDKKRYLVWAANFHIQNDSLKMRDYTSNLFGNLMAKKYKEQYFKIGVMSDNSCKKNSNNRVFPPCKDEDKLDLIVLIQKGNKTTSIFDK
ncbi:MAG: erythromycin esterase family protein [Bacteroidetes bacterium]|nr:erythromycin esterase family protein [Bacteroidota bacterium]